MILADSNVIIAFLLTRGITNQIISAHRDVFIPPEHCYNEIWEHRDVWNKNNLSDDELKEIMEGVQQLFVYPVAEEVYKEKMNLAMELINDPDDAPIVALALSIHNEGVWTYNIKHFLTEKVLYRTSKNGRESHTHPSSSFSLPFTSSGNRANGITITSTPTRE